MSYYVSEWLTERQFDDGHYWTGIDYLIDSGCLLTARVRSDKDRTGTITIVPVRTGTVI